MRDRFERIARTYIERDGLDKLLELVATTDFYTAPASTRYHGSHEGGLVEHSINVFERLREMNNLEDLGFDEESVAIVGLFHDFCKIGFYTTEMRNAKVNGKWTKVPYYTVKDQFPMGHGDKSIIMILQAGLELTDEEMMAIRWHMGGFVPKEEYMTLSEALSQCPLALYTHLADMKATYLDEQKG